ncbi:hypothetical protein BTHERMOSOX_541 [Bathymodiolus thermophilus thioautotrophic gill symbiont]|uniref:Lcl C-terminal domain-containing protein n=1 Tax=Bathymodiolus thermophilus thioautotrophic gill symbiont TaxID=2360 RepID=UPI0010B6618B|nr:DUF1566 domain-containing protein [Bathymodiolus thermophilus thioautotrophic gill symbiont]SHA18586.1 hypothetical protein BTHERMOSOX_541 [Bathymodiolus thermophilus thioautotrophic gill symbiont]
MKKTILFLTINFIFLATHYLLAQVCKDYVPNEWRDNRYTDYGNGTVIDNKTTLMWKKCIQGLSGNNCEGTSIKYNWEEALQLASNHSFASHDDWRLPNIKELGSLASHHCYEPSINESIFPNTPSDYFWSSSPDSLSLNSRFSNSSLNSQVNNSSLNLQVNNSSVNLQLNNSSVNSQVNNSSLNSQPNNSSLNSQPNNSSYSWLLRFYSGSISSYDRSKDYYVRLVRSGQ